MTQPYTTRTRGNGTYQFTMEANVMKTATIKSAFVAGIIAGISPVRANENDYLFVTVTGRDGSAHNVYFGVKSSESVEEGDVLTKEQLLGAQLILAKNDEGATRIKIGLEGTSDYTNLANIFDDVEVVAETTKEVLTALKKVMLTREQSEAEEDDDDADAEATAKAAEVKAARNARKAGRVK